MSRSDERLKVLLVTSRLPFPAVNGGVIRSQFFLERLAKHFDLFLVTLSDQPLTTEGAKYLATHCKEFRVFVVPRWRHLLNMFLALFSAKPLQVGYYLFNHIQRYINALEDRVDFGVAINQRAASYLFGFKKPHYLDMTDSITLNYRNATIKATSWKWRLFYRIESTRIESFEKQCLESYDLTFFVNDQEMRHYNRPKRTHWIPNAIDGTLLNRPRKVPSERAFYFLGKLDYQANVDAICWFATNVLPLIPTNIIWYVIGPYPGRSLEVLSERYSNMRLTGFLLDPWDLAGKCACMVAPMQTGGGSQYKILEAMAMAIPVVTTKYGADPIIGAENGRHLLVVDDPKEMANTICRLVDNTSGGSPVGQAGQELIRSHYTWDSLEKRLLTVLDPILPKSHAL